MTVPGICQSHDTPLVVAPGERLSHCPQCRVLLGVALAADRERRAARSAARTSPDLIVGSAPVRQPAPANDIEHAERVSRIKSRLLAATALAAGTPGGERRAVELDLVMSVLFAARNRVRAHHLACSLCSGYFACPDARQAEDTLALLARVWG